MQPLHDTLACRQARYLVFNFGEQRMPDEKIFQTEIAALQDAALKVWAMYLNWFTWSLGLNLLAISFITTRDTIRADFLSGLSVIMSLSILLAIGAGVKMRTYYLAVLDRMSQLAEKIGNTSMDPYLLIGGGIGGYAAWAIPTVHLAALTGWIIVALKYGERIF
jgi:hypothetical protein